MKHFGLEILAAYGVLEHFKLYRINFVLDCFKYFLILLWDICPKKIRQERNFELYQVVLYNFLCQND